MYTGGETLLPRGLQWGMLPKEPLLWLFMASLSLNWAPSSTAKKSSPLIFLPR